MIYAFFLFVFVQKSFLTKKFFFYVEINLTTGGPLYTCLVTYGNTIFISWMVDACNYRHILNSTVAYQISHLYREMSAKLIIFLN